ncbi:AbgT family transporter [Clostridium tetani]|uniref:Aminobenzoyl-glutamate transport protein n=1 Tax=Clostridium tetani (strain Massachusetts / E88) TaxID=212717 RepID=Q891Q3_CLOTE|nr:AbgT family transporter [Clostridium tetani]AAO36792.1 aminobenzoyl-glutamate transport protein [Clostridium tetani E88]KGI41179.1 aminobenzoyl-glutamate transporter [Clostridium tetani]KGI45927.1 aminobenzoyl-glutamate transporter [Clostridium tetani]KHO31140.1 aminobenzoyl-glutamate transporter [Clostridium tetani]KIG21321.1 aminobenzoyl-glutamate transporter [Clostridium tetani]
MKGSLKTGEKIKVSKKSGFDKFLDKVEVIGNKMPDPVTLFVGLSLMVIIISWLASDVSVINPSTKETAHVVNLMTKDGIRKLLMESVSEFQKFPPLGMVLVVMLGAGVAEKSGLMSAAMENTIRKVPKQLVTATVILISVLSDGAGDAGFVLLPPLAATMFWTIGRNPLVGMFVAYAGVTGGFGANLIVNMTDVLIAGFTIPAAKLVDPNFNSTPAMNIIFMMCSTVILVVAGVYVTEKIIAPRFEGKKIDEDHGNQHVEIGEKEKKALKWAGISIIIIILIVVALCLGENALLKDPETASLLAWKSPLMQGLIPIMTIAFLIPGVIYGKMTGSIKNDKDVVNMMAESMKDMGGFIVLSCVAAIFIALFSWSNLGIVLAVKGTEFLKNSGINGVGIIVGFIILESFINIFIGSASAKWAIMAPIFVPMLMLMGYSPAVTQMAFRIGDSITNPISPLFEFFPLMIVLMRKYDKKAGMGTLISNMLPYSIAFGVLWTILLIFFIIFNIPLGPGGAVRYLIP